MKIKRDIKHWFQRRTRGWSDDETWNLDWEFIRWVNSRFKKYKELASKIINLEFYKFRYKGKTYTQLGLINEIISLSDELIEKHWVYEDDYNEFDKYKELLAMFNKIIYAMWW